MSVFRSVSCKHSKRNILNWKWNWEIKNPLVTTIRHLRLWYTFLNLNWTEGRLTFMPLASLVLHLLRACKEPKTKMCKQNVRKFVMSDSEGDINFAKVFTWNGHSWITHSTFISQCTPKPTVFFLSRRTRQKRTQNRYVLVVLFSPFYSVSTDRFCR